MSYILDALKKAEQERSLSAAPLAQPPSSTALLPVRHATTMRPPLLLALLTLTALLIGLLLWLRPATKEATYTVTVTTASPDPAVHSPLSTPAIMSAIPAPATAPAVKSALVHALPPAAAKAVHKAEEHIPTLAELPESLRRDLPPLDVSGYIYADLASDRSIIINRRFLREGDQLASDLLLEKLTPAGMVLNFRGTRFRTTY